MFKNIPRTLDSAWPLQGVETSKMSDPDPPS